MEVTRWGILSAGKIAHDFANAFSGLNQNEHKLVGIAARDFSTAKKFANDFKLDKAFQTYEELVKDPSIGI